jgi:hypothetical protein
LLLATTDDFLARQREVPPGDVGGYEYRNNDFALRDDDLARAVPIFAPRLASRNDLMHDDQIDYRGPDGQLQADVAGSCSAWPPGG